MVLFFILCPSKRSQVQSTRGVYHQYILFVLYTNTSTVFSNVPLPAGKIIYKMRQSKWQSLSLVVVASLMLCLFDVSNSSKITSMKKVPAEHHAKKSPRPTARRPPPPPKSPAKSFSFALDEYSVRITVGLSGNEQCWYYCIHIPYLNAQ